MSSSARLLIDAVERPLQAFEHTVDIGGVADGASAGGDARPVEMVGDLDAHQLSLLDHFARERIVPFTRFVGDDAERSLERVGEIADMGARPVDDLPVRLDQGIELLLQRLDLGGELALQSLRLAGADRREVVPDRAQRREPEPDLEQRCHHEAKPKHPERRDQHHAEFGEILVDFCGIASDRIGIGCRLRAGRPDLALDDPQALILGAPRVGPSCQVLVGGDALLARQLELLVEQGVGDEERPLRGAFERLDLPIPA